MKAALHYKLKIFQIDFQSKDRIAFDDDIEVFEDENPILARIEAFKKYDEWLKNWYEIKLNKSSENITAKQAIEDLWTLENSHDLHLQLGVYLVIDEPCEPFLDLDEVGETDLIHGIHCGDILDLNEALSREFFYYQYYGYEIGDFKRNIDFYDPEIDEFEKIDILDTPFDWTGYDSRDMWIIDREDPSIPDRKEPNFYEKMISEGEGRQVEFKSSLVYDFNENKMARWVNTQIAKTICAFLNSRGGFLIIGVNDNGNIQGLEEYDFSLAGEKIPKDFFKLEVDRMISHHLGVSKLELIEGDFYNIDNKTIFVFTIFPSKKKVFLNGKGKEFWVRGFASNRQVIGDDEIEDYWDNRENTEK